MWFDLAATASSGCSTPPALGSDDPKPAIARAASAFFAGPRPVDHPLEKPPHRNAAAGGLSLDPRSAVVVEPDADNGGFAGRHDWLTLTLGVYRIGSRMVATRWCVPLSMEQFRKQRVGAEVRLGPFGGVATTSRPPWFHVDEAGVSSRQVPRLTIARKLRRSVDQRGGRPNDRPEGGVTGARSRHPPPVVPPARPRGGHPVEGQVPVGARGPAKQVVTVGTSSPRPSAVGESTTTCARCSEARTGQRSSSGSGTSVLTAL